MSPSDEYQNRLRTREREIDRLERRNERIGNSRLLLGVLTIIAAGFSLLRSMFSLFWILAPVCAFIVLVLYHDRIRRSAEYARRAVDYYRAGLTRIEDRWMGTGQRGDRFVNAHHVYAVDLDLFGANSLFELLCVARTRMGEENLARWLSAPATVDDAQERQEAIKELRAGEWGHSPFSSPKNPMLVQFLTNL